MKTDIEKNKYYTKGYLLPADKYDVTECCPNCGVENTILDWDFEENGLKAYCPRCGSKMLLCSECPLENCEYISSKEPCRFARQQRESLSNMARVYIDAEKSTIRLIASLNPDASDGLQGEIYGEQWTLSLEEATRRCTMFGFWHSFMKIKGRVAGGISLIDAISDKEAIDLITGNVIEVIRIPEYSEKGMKKLADLASGEYAIILENFSYNMQIHAK